MDQVQVRIITTAITHQYGTLETGTVLRTTPEFAKHLVEEARAAKYLGALPEDEPAPEQNDAPAQKRAKKQTETEK